jgi:hypothetical protein
MTRRVTIPATPSVVSSLTASNVTVPLTAANVEPSHVSSSHSALLAAKQQQARAALVDRLSHLEAEITKERLAHEETQRSFQRTAKEVELLREIVAARFESTDQNESRHQNTAVAPKVGTPRKQVKVVAPSAHSRNTDHGDDTASVARSSTIMSTSTLYAQR